jgi:hypothetical protein
MSLELSVNYVSGLNRHGRQRWLAKPYRALYATGAFMQKP